MEIAAARIGVDTATVTTWELGNTEPRNRFIPALIGFLGHNPLPEATSPGEQVRGARLAKGLSIRALAELASGAHDRPKIEIDQRGWS